MYIVALLVVFPVALMAAMYGLVVLFEAYARKEQESKDKRLVSIHDQIYGSFEDRMIMRREMSIMRRVQAEKERERQYAKDVKELAQFKQQHPNLFK